MTAAVSFKQVEEAPASSMVQLVNHAIANYQASMTTLAVPSSTAHPMSYTTSPNKLHVQNDHDCWDNLDYNEAIWELRFEELCQY
eukprot:CAMPEP_0198282562 /NCGR_PEP_ID=MMETSP1449-20131203/2346_1 /TAXON_ID=420275 /ORGANISM="Attheya septentrionalis, Strain CCMP2084" /LENGTH=84 /DNA_ID=CAMNT_0043978843 /DNA_START=305 /DNA_END=556 /DNA_ORIENTATION=+